MKTIIQICEQIKINIQTIITNKFFSMNGDEQLLFIFIIGIILTLLVIFIFLKLDKFFYKKKKKRH